MSEYDETLKSIEEIAEQLKHLQDYAFQQYSKAVDSVIKGQITSKEDIDRLLDYMMDFYEDERFQTLVGRFCSYLLQNRRDCMSDSLESLPSESLGRCHPFALSPHDLLKQVAGHSVASVNRRDVVGPFENFYKLQAEAFSNKEADKP